MDGAAMVEYAEVMDEIERLKRSNTNYANCEKLAVLYSIMDHKDDQAEARTRTYSTPAAPLSEFMQAVKGADPDGVMEILDEHFECIKAVCPKEYAVVLHKINSLKS